MERKIEAARRKHNKTNDSLGIAEGSHLSFMRNGDFNTWNIICKECLIGIFLIFQVDVVHVALPVSIIPYSVKMYTQVTIGDTWSDVRCPMSKQNSLQFLLTPTVTSSTQLIHQYNFLL